MNKTQLTLSPPRKNFIASLMAVISGLAAVRYAGSYSYVDANNVLHDTAWLPIGWLLIFLGLFLFLVAIGRYGVYRWRLRG